MNGEQVRPSWFTEDVADVIKLTHDAVNRFSIDEFQRNLFGDLLDEASLLTHAELGGCAVPVHLPLQIFNAVGASTEIAKALAVALVLLETGIYVLDHLMDDELGEHLAQRPRAVVLTAATCFLTYLPQMALDGIPCDIESRLKLNATLQAGLSKIGHGQLLDVGLKFDQMPSPELIERSVIGKTGARRALYARMAAQLAGASSQQTEAYTAFGEALGVARQFNSDVFDIFSARLSRDIEAGICTLPFALYFADASGPRRELMLSLVKDSRHDPSALAVLRSQLTKAGALRKTLIRKEAFCARARRHLRAASPPSKAADFLAALVDEVSWLNHA